MSLTNEQYQEIMRMYEANRLSGYNLSRERKREVYAQIPQMRDLGPGDGSQRCSPGKTADRIQRS